jgi:hypothetical protein
MTLVSSGQISAGVSSPANQSINTELGKAYNAQLSLNDTDARALAGITGAGTQISYSSFYGKSSAFIYNQIISVNTTNYNMRDAAIAAGWNTTSKLIMSVTINSGVVVYGSNGTVAFNTGANIPSGSSLTLVVNGTILGGGGTGGSGTFYMDPPPFLKGSWGRPALFLYYSVAITNNGRIAGGGGGGGAGGGAESHHPYYQYGYAQGGGGGGGIGNGPGGPSGSLGAGQYSENGTPTATSGTLTSAGIGGIGGYGSGGTDNSWGGDGGNGGSYGSAGANGQDGIANYYPIQSGGFANANLGGTGGPAGILTNTFASSGSTYSGSGILNGAYS